MRAQQFIAFTRRDLEARQAKAAALEKQLYPDSTKVWCVCGAVLSGGWCHRQWQLWMTDTGAPSAQDRRCARLLLRCH